jgi:hypothetical protein
MAFRRDVNENMVNRYVRYPLNAREIEEAVRGQHRLQCGRCWPECWPLATLWSPAGIPAGWSSGGAASPTVTTAAGESAGRRVRGLLSTSCSTSDSS